MKILYILKHTPLIISLLLLLNCTSSNNRYYYIEGFERYLNDIHQKENFGENNVIYYITPISDNCDSCIESNLILLNNLNTELNLTPILVGKNQDKNYSKVIDEVVNKYPEILFDSNSKIFSYQTGFGKPLLIHVKNGRCIYFMEITDFKLDEAKSYLENQ